MSLSNRLEVSLPLVTELIKEQFPQWAHLEIKPVKISGWDNTTFRAQGWALWKALITLAALKESNVLEIKKQKQLIHEICTQ